MSSVSVISNRNTESALRRYAGELTATMKLIRLRTLAAAGRSSRKASTFVIVGVLGAVILTMWLAVIASIETTKQAALESAHFESRNLMMAFRQEIEFFLRGIEGELRLLARQVQRQGRHFDLYRWSQENILLSPGVAQASFIGPEGKLLSTTLTAAPEATDLADRDHFQVHLSGGAKGLYIGRSVVGRLSRVPILPISLRVDAEDGSLLGVLVVLVTPEALSGLHKYIDLGPNGVMTLTGDDEVIRARYSADSPDGTKGIGERLPGIVSRLNREKAEGGQVGHSRLDGVQRIYSFGRISEYPVIVSVGLDLNREMAASHKHAEILGILALTVTMLLVGLGGYLVREIGIRNAHEIDLAEKGAKLQSANIALLDSKDRAEAASRAKSLFLANMSHELRTPLNAIIGYSQVIRDQIFGPGARDRYIEYAGDVVHSGEHLLALIVQILDTAKIEAGKLELNEEKLLFPELIEYSITQVRLLVERKRISLHRDVERDLPAICGDSGRLTQVLINLLSNAVKFTPEGGDIGISVHRDDAGNLVCLVRDTGIGMSPAETLIALEPFSQVDNSLTKSHEGTGLGLPLAKRLVELHGGTLEVHSAKNAGTTVRLCLPAERTIEPFGSMQIEAVSEIARQRHGALSEV